VSVVPADVDDPFGDAPLAAVSPPLAAVSPPLEEESPDEEDPLLGGFDVVVDDESHLGAPSSSDFVVF
jgi:hypothetical protein